MSHHAGPVNPVSAEALRELGQVVRDLRRRRWLSQRVLAARCGLSQSTISRLETGKAPGIRLVWFARILVSLELGSEPPGRPWWHVEEAPSWVAQMRRFATNGAFARRLREQALGREAERQQRLMQLQASMRGLLDAEALEGAGSSATPRREVT